MIPHFRKPLLNLTLILICVLMSVTAIAGNVDKKVTIYGVISALEPDGSRRLTINLEGNLEDSSKDVADALASKSPQIRLINAESVDSELAVATVIDPGTWISKKKQPENPLSKTYICQRQLTLIVDPEKFVLEIQKVNDYTFELGEFWGNGGCRMDGAPDGWIRFFVYDRKKVNAAILNSKFDTGYAVKDSAGRIGIHGNFSQSNIDVKNNDVSRTTMNLDYGATYFTNSGFVGDTRGDQSSTDALTFDYRIDQYRTGRGLNRFGLTGRLDKKFKGWESVAYCVPKLWVAPDNRKLVVIEVEAGARNLVEFKNATTISGVQNNGFARVAGMIEFLPNFGSKKGDINSNPGTGTQLYLRGRGWGDTVTLANSKTGTRFRGFFDAELSQTFGAKRVFVRFETGSLPPDLSKATHRIFVGVGAKF